MTYSQPSTELVEQMNTLELRAQLQLAHNALVQSDADLLNARVAWPVLWDEGRPHCQHCGADLKEKGELTGAVAIPDAHYAGETPASDVKP